jgi:hypothetical protein
VPPWRTKNGITEHKSIAVELVYSWLATVAVEVTLTCALEVEFGRLVYGLCGLTEDEIMLVEGNGKE